MNFDLIIKRIMSRKGFKNEKEVAELFGLSAGDFSIRKKRGSLLPLIVNWAINENMSLDRLIKVTMPAEQPVVVSERRAGIQPRNLGEERRREVLFYQLQRIMDEGDQDKIDAVKVLLGEFDPGEKNREHD